MTYHRKLIENVPLWLPVLLALAMPIVSVTSAYATQLNAVGVVTPEGAFAESFSSIGPREFIAVVNSETFMVRWLQTAGKDRTHLLWSAYPASIRGQIFSGQPAGGNPLVTGGW
jgi:hypothetical protein